MINTSDCCIFCGNKLTNKEKKGRGEHIIPEYLKGIVTIKDVCDRCNKYFGRNIDLNLLKDKRIIQAAKDLDLNNVKKNIVLNNPTDGFDAIDHKNIKMSFKNEKLYVDWNENDDGMIECNEVSLKQFWQGQIIKGIKQGYYDEETLQHFTNVDWPRYENTPENVIFTPAIPGIKIQKRQLSSSITKININSELTKRAISKIAFESIWLINHFIPNIINFAYDDWDLLRRIALNQSPTPDHMFRFFNIETNAIYRHEITIQFPIDIPHHMWINVILYGIAGFRVIMKSKNQYCSIFKLEDGTKIDRFGLSMNFNPEMDREKYIGFRINSSSIWKSINVTDRI